MTDRTMPAIQLTAFGGPAVLEEARVPVPEPGPGQVRIAVHAAAVNPVDAKIRRGDLEQVFPTPLPAVLGLDAAGVVDAVGPDTSGVRVGDAVLGSARGGAYAGRALLEGFVPKPASVPWPVAAAIPTTGETAVRALARSGVRPGQIIVVLGAAGSVGSVITQLAIARGIIVVGTVAADDDAATARLGAVPLRYGAGLVHRMHAMGVDVVDAVIDTAGRGPMEEVLQLVSGPERVVTLVDGAAAARHGIRFTGADPSDREPDGVSLVTAMVARGIVRLRIGAEYPLAEAWRAHQALEAGGAKGRIVLTGPWERP